MQYKTVLFSPPEGDVTFPITPVSLDSMTLGANDPIKSMNVIAANFSGSISGAGFNTAVQSIISGTIPSLRYLPLTGVKSDNGLPLLTGTAAPTLAGISRTAGSSLFLTGAPTVGVTPAITNMIWEFNLPDTYFNGNDINIAINCVVPIATNVTAASTTMTVAAYKVSNLGVETAISVSSLQQMPLTTSATLNYNITGTGLTIGTRIVLELTAFVTTIVGGASSARINSVGYTA